ncbi:MAG: DUF4959 domain-containing protein [Flavobacteriaceae bacterium]|nr:DUF4959 domain-containing protein [Flavobacteriaceae bacterium]
MKKLNKRVDGIFTSALAMVLLLFGCNEYLSPDVYVKNNEQPPALVSANVTNINGGAKIEFELPKGLDDLLYVKATYLRNGELAEAKVSRYDNELYVRGLRDTNQTVDVTLTVGNSSGKESEPIIVQIKPLIAPLDYALQTISAGETFGGLDLSWENPTEATLVAKVYTNAVVTPEEEPVLTEIFSEDTKLPSPEYKVRGEVIGGLDPVPTDFQFIFRDIYGNETEPITLTRTPIFEQYLEPVATDIFPFNGISEHSATLANDDPTLTWDGPNWGDRASYKLWDGRWATYGDCYWAVAHDLGNLGGDEVFKNKKSAFVTLDLQNPSKLSRYHVYNMTNKQFVWNESSPRKWRIWVTPDLTEEAAKVWGPDSNWEVAQEFTVPPPRDGKIAHDVTDSDWQTWREGWEQELTHIDYPVRFIRLEVYEAWVSTVGGAATGEFQVYGAPQSDD